MKITTIIIPLGLATQALANPVNLKAARKAAPVDFGNVLEGPLFTIGNAVKDATNVVDNALDAVDGTGAEGITIGGPIPIGSGGIGTGKRESDLTSRNPAADAASSLDKRFLPILGPLCVPICTVLDSVCQLVGVTLATLTYGEFDPINRKVCIPTYCGCQDKCGLADNEIDYFCYKKNGGPLPDKFENCDEHCCDEHCREPEPPKDEDPDEGYECSDNEILLGLPCFSDGV